MTSEGRRRHGVAACLAAVCIAAGACSPLHRPSVPAPAPAAASVSPAPLAGPFDWRDAVLYFVVLDRFADGDPGNNRQVDRGAKGAFHGGDLAGLTAHLDEIAELGVNALWVTPLVRNIPGFVTGAGFPDWGYHGYWADDFEQLDPRFGSEEELARLVAEAHRRGIRVLLDVVYNHAGYGSRYLRDPRTRDWLRSEERGTCGADDLTGCLSGLPDFRTDLPEVREHLLAAHLGLAARVGLDGFRLDTVKHVEHDFWQEHRRRTRAELGESFFLLGEVWGGDAGVLDPWFAGDELDAGFDFGFQGSVLGFVAGRGRPAAFDRYLRSRERPRPGYHLAHFLSSHDTPGALHQLDGDRERFLLAAVLQLTTAGIPTIYYGEEVGRPGGDWPENRSDMPWGERQILPGAGEPRDEALRADYRRLIGLRRERAALRRGTHEGLLAEGDLLVFARRDAESGDVAVVVLNRGAEGATARFAAPAEWQGRPARDAWAGRAVAATADGELELTLPPRGASILVAEARP